MYYIFQLTRLMRGVTGTLRLPSHINGISTHTPHARRDYGHDSRIGNVLEFQLTRLMRGVTEHIVFFTKFRQFQLTRLMRGVTECIICI